MCANARNKSQHVGSLDEKTRDSGTFSISDAVLCIVCMYLCWYVAFSARAPAQHCWMCCANERNIVGPRFDDREKIEMLALVGSEVWPVLNFIQQLPTTRNNTQQHTTWCANARKKLGTTMLRAFVGAFRLLRNLISHLHPNFPPKLWENKKKETLFFDDFKPLHTNGW